MHTKTDHVATCGLSEGLPALAALQRAHLVADGAGRRFFPVLSPFISIRLEILFFHMLRSYTKAVYVANGPAFQASLALEKATLGSRATHLHRASCGAPA